MDEAFRIYMVTVGYLPDLVDPKKAKDRRWRCWGYYLDAETAKKCVLENWTDIFEDGYYNVAVIEAIPEGVVPIGTQEIGWYRYDDDTDAGVPMERPPVLKHYCMFAFA